MRRRSVYASKYPFMHSLLSSRSLCYQRFKILKKEVLCYIYKHVENCLYTLEYTNFDPQLVSYYPIFSSPSLSIYPRFLFSLEWSYNINSPLSSANSQKNNRIKNKGLACGNMFTFFYLNFDHKSASICFLNVIFVNGFLKI